MPHQCLFSSFNGAPPGFSLKPVAQILKLVYGFAR
jgi:hypothetical protein